MLILAVLGWLAFLSQETQSSGLDWVFPGQWLNYLSPKVQQICCLDFLLISNKKRQTAWNSELNFSFFQVRLHRPWLGLPWGATSQHIALRYQISSAGKKIPTALTDKRQHQLLDESISWGEPLVDCYQNIWCQKDPTWCISKSWHSVTRMKSSTKVVTDSENQQNVLWPRKVCDLDQE